MGADEIGAGEDLVAIDTADQGNLKMRLVHAFNPRRQIERAQDGLARDHALSCLLECKVA